MQLRRPESTQSDLQKDTILGHVNYYILINLVQRRNRQGRTPNFRMFGKGSIPMQHGGENIGFIQ
jgi:hypothetical protein